MKKIILLCAVLLVVFLPVYVYGEEYEDDIVILTYDEALALAVESLPAIWDLEAHIEELEETRDDLRDDLRRISWAGGDAVAAMRREMTELDRLIASANMEIETLVLRTELSLRTQLISIINNAMDIEAAKGSMDLSRENLRHIELRLRFGMASANDLRLANARITQEYMSLDILLAAQASIREDLNYFLDLPPYQYVIIEFERYLPEMPENLSPLITQAVSQAPTSRRMQFDVLRARESLALHRERCTYRGRRRNVCDTCDTLIDRYDRAVIDRNIEIRRMETALRAAYNRLEQLQTQEAAAILALEQGQDALEIIKTNLDLGRATQFDVDSAIVARHVMEQAIERILYQQWVLVLSLANPELL